MIFYKTAMLSSDNSLILMSDSTVDKEKCIVNVKCGGGPGVVLTRCNSL